MYLIDLPLKNGSAEAYIVEKHYHFFVSSDLFSLFFLPIQMGTFANNHLV